MAHAEDTGTIDCLEIFLMLGLFCDGDQKDQLGFCFEIFDTDHRCVCLSHHAAAMWCNLVYTSIHLYTLDNHNHSNNITLDEMIHFFQVLCRAAYKVHRHLSCAPQSLIHTRLLLHLLLPLLLSLPAAPPTAPPAVSTRLASPFACPRNRR